MVKMGTAIDDDSPAEDLHELRKVGKELRYLLEFFASLYPRRGRQAVRQDAQGPAGPARPLPGPRGAGQRAARARARRRGPDDADGDGRARRPLHQGRGRWRAWSSPTASPPSPRPSSARIVKEHFAMSRVLATYNIKGGVGKTSAAVNLATLAARDGAPTLLWDLDPQGASTYLFRVRAKVKGGGAKLVRGKSDVDGAAQGHRHRGPGPAAGRLLLPPHGPRARRRQAARAPASRASSSRSQDEYEYTFLDCPPSISLVSESVFEAADALLVPIIPATLSSRTLEQLHSVLAQRRPAGPRLLLDGRPPQEAAPRADGQPRRGARRARDRDPERGRRRADGRAAAPRSWTSRRKSRAARAYADLWEEVRGALSIRSVTAWSGGHVPAQVASRRRCASGSDSSFLSVWFSICRMRSRVTLNARPTSSSV